MAATGQARAAIPRIKLSSRGFPIDHPDREYGERLRSDALGVSDRDAMHGILGQLMKATAQAGCCPERCGSTKTSTTMAAAKDTDAVYRLSASPP